jgi:hypothetical protein
MGCDGTVKESVVTVSGSVNELVTNDKVAGLDVSLQTADGVGSENSLDAENLHRPDVRFVGDFVGRILVLATVPRQESHPLASDFNDGNQVTRHAERSFNFDFLKHCCTFNVVKSRTAENTNLCLPLFDFGEHLSLTLLSVFAFVAYLPQWQFHDEFCST